MSQRVNYPDKCPFCGADYHIHIEYETDEELAEYLESCDTYDELSKSPVAYFKVPKGQGTGSKFDAMFGPLLDNLDSDAVEKDLNKTPGFGTHIKKVSPS